MWHHSFCSIAVVTTLLRLSLGERIEARDGKQSDKNAIREPLGGTIDTKWPVLIRWNPDTKGTVSLKLLKGKAQSDMQEVETIADHVKNTGIYIWLTGDWLEDSSTMPKGYKYGLKIIDNETGNYNFGLDFDLIVPHSTFKADNNSGKDKTATNGSNKHTTGEDVDFEEPDQVGTGHEKPKSQTGSKGNPLGDDDNAGYEDKDPTLGVGKDYTYHGKPKPLDKGAQTKGSTKEPIPDKEVDFEETVKGTTKPPLNGNSDLSVANVDSQTTITQQDQQNTTTTSTPSSGGGGGLPQAAVIGIVVGVLVTVILIALGIGFWKLTRHKKVMVEKNRSRIGYDGVAGFIAGGRKEVLYDGPQMAQYTPRQSMETRYDPPTGQGLPVVGHTARRSVDTKYDSPRHSVDTRYDPPSQAQPVHY